MSPRKETLYKIIKVCLSFVIFGFGSYLTIRANIGLAPWECFSMGVSKQVGASYGTTHMVIGFVIIAIDLLLKEKIGLGTILDALIIGPVVDLCTNILPIPLMTKWYYGVPLMILGLFIIAFSQVLYQGTGLSCGPRDAFVIGVGKRLRKLKMGAVQIVVLAVVLTAGFLLGGPVGIGTIVGAFGTGITVNIVFGLLHFEPRDVVQEDVITSCRKLIQNK